jgi:hypothetical protein
MGLANTRSNDAIRKAGITATTELAERIGYYQDEDGEPIAVHGSHQELRDRWRRLSLEYYERSNRIRAGLAGLSRSGAGITTTETLGKRPIVYCTECGIAGGVMSRNALGKPVCADCEPNGTSSTGPIKRRPKPNDALLRALDVVPEVEMPSAATPLSMRPSPPAPETGS